VVAQQNRWAASAKESSGPAEGLRVLETFWKDIDFRRHPALGLPGRVSVCFFGVGSLRYWLALGRRNRAQEGAPWPLGGIRGH